MMTSATPALLHAQRIEALFRRKPVADLGEMQRALGTCGRTVFRVLRPLGYLTSYSHAGRYYTLKQIPEFNAQGLWFYQDVRFSTHGTLRATVEFMVKHAATGHTHEELQAILGLRVHDTLLSLATAGRIGRDHVADLYIYVDPVGDVAAAQLAQRRQQRAAASALVAVSAPLDAARIIDVLVAVIHHPRATAPQVGVQLRKRGLAVTDAQVVEVFACYALGKKTARSPSPRSRR